MEEKIEKIIAFVQSLPQHMGLQTEYGWLRVRAEKLIKELEKGS